VLRSSPLRRGPWPSRYVKSVATSPAQSCTAAHSRLASLNLGASRLAQLATASRDLAVPLRATCRASRLIQLKAARRPTAASRHSTSERRVLRSSPLRRGPWPSRCVHSVASGSAQSCTAAHSRLASLHLGASRFAQLAAASRHLAVPLRAQCRAWFSLKLHGGPPPPPPRSVAPCAARRCVAGLGRPAPCIASRLVQLKAVRRPTAASRHSTSESRALRSSPLRRGTGPSRYVQSVATSPAQSCTAAHSRLATLHLGASRLAQLAAASRHLAVPLRAQCRA